MRAQAIVEMALILPILLMLVLGIIWLGLISVMRYELVHAAAEGAIAGVLNPADSCGFAVTIARKVYQRDLDVATCEVSGQLLEVRLVDTLAFPTPWGTTFSVVAEERAAVR